MLNLERYKCYEVSYHSDWRDQYSQKVKIITAKNAYSDRVHSYGTISPKGFCYIWDYGWEKGTSVVYSGSNYSIVSARELEGTELEEFEKDLLTR